MELELKLPELELELELKFCKGFFIYTYIQVLFETYSFETVPIILCLLTR